MTPPASPIATIPPHILRLLSLIRSPPTPEHSAMASSLLQNQLSTRTPAFLWLILGFVASFLYREDEKGRLSAARCLESIARLVPKASRDAFLSTSAPTTTSSSCTPPSASSSQFLDISLMVANNCKTFEVVLSKGIELNSRGWEDPSIVTRLIDGVSSPEERIKMQRSILLHRLGMSMTSGHEALGHTKSLQGLISEKDIETGGVAMTKKVMEEPPTKRQKTKMDNKGKKDEEMETPEMALLLMRTMERQTLTSSGSTSHLLPQSLLATDIIFNMFSPNWHIRHGAVMGMLHLLKAWSTPSTTSSPTPGLWVKDILCRTLCLLILDRFGDYTSPHRTVHPIRESAGQLMAFIGTIVEEKEIEMISSALSWMRMKTQWEVRHGSCVGFKYLKLTRSDLMLKYHPKLVPNAVEDLVDESDDVKMGAAQVLGGILMMEANNNEIPNLAFKNAWDALILTDEMSSHATDLLRLISLISNSTVGVRKLGGVNCSELFRFLDHTSSTVQIEGMKLFSSILNSVDLPPAFMASLMLKLLESSRSNHQIEGVEGRRLNAARAEAFKVAVDKMKEKGLSWDGLEAFVKKAVVAYFAPKNRSTRHANLFNTMKLHSQLMSPGEFAIITRSARFLSLLHMALGYESIAFGAIKVFLPSPFVQDVEAAVILYDRLPSSDFQLEESMMAV
mmetsp:Transcript_15267/g.31473  ORF Transcript_15267/g.31473 Transcript_15267/m.31473 type:complete len:678 (+) Transcript_15267:50-2083(+)